MKKTKVLLTTLLTSAVVLSGCSNEKKEVANNDSNTNQTEQTSNDSKEKVYKLNEEWKVKDQWKLKVTEVKATSERSKEEGAIPVEEVVKISYTYENLGYKGKTGTDDLSILPMSVIDGAKQVVYNYPLDTQKFPAFAPIGAKSDGVFSYGLTVKSDKIKVVFEQTDNEGNKHRATFEVPVTK